MNDLPLVFLAGVLGSAHCVGMCGGFVALLGVGGGAGTAARQAAYFGGKTLAYAALGAVAGLAGGLVTALLGGFQGVLALALGVGMAVAGLALCGAFRWRKGAAGVPAGVRWLAPAVGRLVADGRPARLVALGALNGLLPCGLVYGLLVKAAAAGSFWGGAATMAAFGLGTVPALALTATLGARLPAAGRLTMQRLAGVLVLALGLLTAARGVSALDRPAGPSNAAAAGLVCHPGGPQAASR